MYQIRVYLVIRRVFPGYFEQKCPGNTCRNSWKHPNLSSQNLFWSNYEQVFPGILMSILKSRSINIQKTWSFGDSVYDQSRICLMSGNQCIFFVWNDFFSNIFVSAKIFSSVSKIFSGNFQIFLKNLQILKEKTFLKRKISKMIACGGLKSV